MQKKEIIPVLLGADLNCYNLARAFHEAYGVISYAFGRYEISATKYSKIIRFTTVPDIDDETVMLRVLTEFAEAHPNAQLYLLGCTDDYAAMIIRRRGELPWYIAPAPDAKLYESLQKKADFYQVCDQHGIPYPDTVVLEAVPNRDQVTEEALGFPYPIIIKPSSSVDYWKYPFDGMKKVYVSADPDESVAIIRQIYAAGYPDKMILQKRILGGDSEMRVLTAFSDERGKVRAMCLGHTMIEEHTPKGLGNHAAIVTEPVSSLPIAESIKKMLESVGYTGFSNFDIKHAGDGDYRVFEINLRQGRSNYYVTGSGINIAHLAVEKWQDTGTDCQMQEEASFWHHVPAGVAYRYTEDRELAAQAKELRRAGRSNCSLKYSYDLRGNFLRRLCVLEQLRRQRGKFRKYYPKNGI
ncbi:MAG: ATP-grasp domain-containing protein [Clostridiales bacterium]|nr:ATP-grasp domain-containing protein [Clostridiales bacterium]